MPRRSSSNADTLVFSSTATDPAQPLDPEVAKNGNIYNIWTLNLKNGELRQFTDTLGGNLSTIVLPTRPQAPQLAFISYYKTEWELHALERRDPIITAASSDFGAPGPIIDFQAPLSHTLVADKVKKKGKFEKMFVDGRPPVAVGVTSGGDHLRRHGGHVQRRARRPAVQLVRRLRLAVPHVLAVVH